jgi:hypothetical protein
MDAFESLVSMLLRHDGYWTIPSFKVKLTKEEKRDIGRHSSPRWELDLVAYKGSTNEVLAVECKSFLDSTGVTFRREKFEPEDRYKLFNDDVLRSVVFSRLAKQLVETGATAPSPTVTLCLAIGKTADKSDREGLKRHFNAKGWRLFDVEWLRERLRLASQGGYENDVAFVVSKILLRDKATLPAESKARLREPRNTIGEC